MQNKEQITGALSLAAEGRSSGHIGEVWPTISVRWPGPTQRAGKSDRKVGVWMQTQGSHPAQASKWSFLFFLIIFNFLYLCLTVLSLHYCAGFSPVQRVRATPSCRVRRLLTAAASPAG